MAKVSTIQLTATQIKKLIDDLREWVRQLIAKIKILMQIAAQLLAMWEGDAAKAFDAVFKKEVVVFEKFAKLVEGYAAALESILNTYKVTEARNCQIAKTRRH